VGCGLALLALSACGGGGGGGPGAAPGTPVIQTFTSWTALGANQRVTAQGITTTAGFTTGLGGAVTITSPFGPANTASSSASVTTGVGFTQPTNLDLTAFEIAAPVGGVTWDEAIATGAASVTCGATQCTATKDGGLSEATVINPYFRGWDYQTFGVWSTSTAGAGTFGAISFGAPTPVAALPGSGLATYAGIAAGVYVDASGNRYGTSATMNANVDFGPRSVSVTVSGTTAVPVGGAPPLANPGGLNYTANGFVTLGTSQFAITGVNTQDGSLTGGVAGTLYGPARQEIGGVYNFSGAGGATMGGAFGGNCTSGC
jgi:hypothetical protein